MYMNPISFLFTIFSVITLSEDEDGESAAGGGAAGGGAAASGATNSKVNSGSKETDTDDDGPRIKMSNPKRNGFLGAAFATMLGNWSIEEEKMQEQMRTCEDMRRGIVTMRKPAAKEAVVGEHDEESRNDPDYTDSASRPEKRRKCRHEASGIQTEHVRLGSLQMFKYGRRPQSSMKHQKRLEILCEGGECSGITLEEKVRFLEVVQGSRELKMDCRIVELDEIFMNALCHCGGGGDQDEYDEGVANLNKGKTQELYAALKEVEHTSKRVSAFRLDAATHALEDIRRLRNVLETSEGLKLSDDSVLSDMIHRYTAAIEDRKRKRAAEYESVSESDESDESEESEFEEEDSDDEGSDDEDSDDEDELLKKALPKFAVTEYEFIQYQHFLMNPTKYYCPDGIIQNNRKMYEIEKKWDQLAEHYNSYIYTPPKVIVYS